MTVKFNKSSYIDTLVHYGYQSTNYAMEPVRIYVFFILRSFVAPSLDKVDRAQILDRFKSALAGTEDFKARLSCDHSPILTCSNLLQYVNALDKTPETESIDYIGSPGERPRLDGETGVYITPETANVSDHFPIIINLKRGPK